MHDGCIFATKRGYGDWRGWWEYPGGKQEPGEAPEDALVREIREEIATEISAGGVHHPDALLQADSGRGTVSGGRLCRRIRKLQEEGQKVSLSGDNAGYTVISINLPSGSAMQLS